MKKIIAIFFASIIVSGCANSVTRELNTVRSGFADNNFVAAADTYAESKPIADQDSLELLTTGLANFQAKNYKLSDDAFEEFNKRNYDTIGGSIVHEAKTLIGGGLADEYKPSMMDSLFVSYYQIWDAIGDGRKNDVRVIINQSYARQQDMSRAYADLVEKNQNRTDESAQELMTTLQQQNATWAAYTDIMNPALMYLSGIWFLNAGDFNDATTYLKRAVGMAQNNDYVADDLNLAESKTRPQNTTWVFIESGFAPGLTEKEISLPFITTNGIIWISVAVAEPVFNNSNVSVSGAKHLADVNAMFMTEFNEYRINDALRSWASATTRAVAQAVAYNSNSKYAGWVGLASTIFSLATTNAEVRSWVTLPADISVMRLKTADLIKNNFIATLDMELPKKGNYLIYVRLTGGTPNVHIFKI